MNSGAILLATANFDNHWGLRCLIVGVLFSAIGLINRLTVQRHQSEEERESHNASLFGGRIFIIGLLGIPLVAVGLVLLLLSIT